MRIRFMWLLCQMHFCIASSTFAVSADIHVSAHQKLSAALEAAKGGDVLLLEPGNYGEIHLDGRKNPSYRFDAPVTIRSSDIANRAIFSIVSLRDVTNLKFESVILDYVFNTGDPIYKVGFSAVNCEGIEVTSSDFDGDNAQGTGTFADGYGSGIGLAFGNSNRIVVADNTFHTWHRGAAFTSNTDLTVFGNELWDLRSDGLIFVEVHDVAIEENHIHSFRLSLNSGDHQDMIQFWTTNTKRPSSDVVIRKNFLNASPNGQTQSIFMRNEAVDSQGAGKEMYYKNIRIEGNVIRNGHLHGITVGESDGLNVVANSLIQLLTDKEGGNVSIPSINISAKSLNVRVSGNVIPRALNFGQLTPPSWVVQSNFVAQRDERGARNHYNNVFINAESGSAVTLADLRFLPTSEPAKLGIGSPLNQFDTHPDTLEGFIMSELVDMRELRWRFDGKHIYHSSGLLDTASAKFRWDFGDDTVGQGITTMHSYDRAGTYVVSVYVTLKEGRQIEMRRTVSVGVQ